MKLAIVLFAAALFAASVAAAQPAAAWHGENEIGYRYENTEYYNFSTLPQHAKDALQNQCA